MIVFEWDNFYSSLSIETIRYKLYVFKYVGLIEVNSLSKILSIPILIYKYLLSTEDWYLYRITFFDKTIPILKLNQ